MTTPALSSTKELIIAFIAPRQQGRFRFRFTLFRRLGFNVALAFFSLLTLLGASAHAANIVVNAQQGSALGCNLFDAVTAANTDAASGNCSAGSGDDVILLSASLPEIVTGTITTPIDNVLGRPFFPTITSKVSIIGFGNSPTIIRRNTSDTYRFFNVRDGGDLTLINLVLTNGNGDGFNGGALLLFCNAKATLENVELRGNSARNGGAIYVIGSGSGCTGPIPSLLLRHSTLANNTANRSILNGVGGLGGAIEMSVNSSVSIIDSTLSGNVAGSAGGAIAFTGTPNVSLFVLNSTIVDNRSGSDGGAIWLFTNDTEAENSIIVRNSIVSGNQAVEKGQDIWVRNLLTLASKQFQNNVFGSSAYSFTDATNLIELLTGNSLHTSDSSNPRSLNQIVRPLADNGGPTRSHEPAPLSPAINTGLDVIYTGSFPLIIPNSGCRDASLITGIGEYRQDQTLKDRPIGEACDIGAVESRFGVDDEFCWVISSANSAVITLCL